MSPRSTTHWRRTQAVARLVSTQPSWDDWIIIGFDSFIHSRLLVVLVCISFPYSDEHSSSDEHGIDRIYLYHYHHSQIIPHLDFIQPPSNPIIWIISWPSTINPITLILRDRCEDACPSGVGVEPLNNTSMLVVLRVQANVAVSKGLGDDDGGLFGIEVSLAGFSRTQIAWYGRPRPTC